MRLALIGYGKIAPKHLEVFRALGCEIVAACNRSAEGRARAQSEGGIARTFTAPLEMIETEKPDAVVCCVSCESTFEVAREIIPTGVPLLLEKPPGLRLAELETLRSLTRDRGTIVHVGLNRRFSSMLQRAIDDAGGRDAISSVWLDWSEDPALLLERGLSRAQASRQVFRNSLHGLDLLVHLCGDFAAPAIAARSSGEPLMWEMSLQGVSERGVIGSFRSTWVGPGRWRLTFSAKNRMYVFAPLETCKVMERGQKGERTIEPDEWDQRFKPGFAGQARLFLEAIRKGAAPGACTLDDALPSMRLAERLTEALTC